MATLTSIKFPGRDYEYGCSVLILFYMTLSPALIITLQAEIYNSATQTWCNNDTYYAEGSVFQSNLNAVMYSLVQSTSQTGFNTSMYGQSADRIYGLLQCRGDATAEQCYNCSQKATTTIRQSQGCGNATDGRIWLELCYLHYDNSSFIGQLDNSYWLYYQDPNKVTRPDVFNAALRDLFTKLSAEAAANGSKNRYASGKTRDELLRDINGLVQCTRDISTEDCKTCLSDTINGIFASYYGNQGAWAWKGSCLVRYDINIFFAPTALSPSPAKAPANMPAVTPSSTNRLSNKIPIILGVVLGGLLLAILICLFRTRRRLNGYKVQEKAAEEDTLVSEDSQIVTFNMETLVTATDNFSDDNKLGEGGFGPVYKGTASDGKEIAVKKLSLKSKQGKKEFLTEVNLVAKIQHRNLVKLRGCCAEGTERLLVYEYLPNSSLDKFLFDPIKRKQLDWKKRYNIILGVARGLLYLHDDSQPRIIHRDIKASNILLDEKLNPKIADFGLAKLFPEDESYVSTKVAGTLGYMAPEYAMHGQLSSKVDVYSFGVLLLELVTGRKNTDFNLSDEMQILLRWVWRSYEAGNSVEIIDPLAMIESCDEEEALRCIQVGIWCTQSDSSLRPPMSTVTLVLSYHSVTLPDFTKPGFANSVTQINTRYSSSVSGLSNSYATTSSASSQLTPAPPSNAESCSIELVPR